MNNTNMVEIFSNGITTCVAPQEIADRFHNELTEDERAKITDGFVRNQDTIGTGSCRYTFAITSSRGIDLRYFGKTEYEMGNKSVHLRVTTLDVSIDSDSDIETEDQQN
ncbi:MAG: hypothetical protein LBI47_01345 [Puniceicoccales bacterium]|nr:hypothetical protein [Puniceicoccales bacterium]